MTTRASLHWIIDALPDAMLPIAARWLSELVADAAAPYVPLHEAPLAEREEDELQALAEGRAAIARGDWISHEELKHKLGF